MTEYAYDPVFLQDRAPGRALISDEQLAACDRGWWLAEEDGQFLIQFADGRPPIIGTHEAHAYVESHSKSNDNNDQEVTEMPSKQANHIDETADEVTGLIEKYQSGPITFIGQSAKTAAAVAKTKGPWMQLLRDRELVLGRVTLDTEPEQAGRPQPGRPGVTQIVFLCLPEEHYLCKPGHQEVVAIRYQPMTTYPAVVQEGGLMYHEDRASGFDTEGIEGIVAFFPSLSAAQEERSDLWRAVQAHSKTGLNDEEVDASTRDAISERWNDPAYWGL